jgi:heat shock protein HtpX
MDQYPYRYRFRDLVRDARLSGFERHTLITGALLVPASVVLAFANRSTDGPARVLAAVAFAVLALCTASRGARLYHASAAASLPRSVGRVPVRVRPRSVWTLATAALAVGLPIAATVVFLALVGWGWLAVAGVLLVGGLAMISSLRRSLEGRRLDYRRDPPPEAGRLLERLCMRADLPVPELVVESGPIPNAWTSGGRIHVTPRLLRLLDDSELEAVLAHEVAHLAHRDVAAMDVCSAPSRLLLGFVGLVGTPRWTRHLAATGAIRTAATVAVLSILSVPPAFVLGWLSRLSVLGMSRSREFAADAAAAALTGRPTALASALVKLDRASDLMPLADLRQTQARALICVVGTDRSPLGRAFCTHPPTAARVARLQEIEERLHGGARA